MLFSDSFPLIYVYSFVSFPHIVPPSSFFIPIIIIVTISPFFPEVLVQSRVPFRLLFQSCNAWQWLLLFLPWSFSIVFLSVSFVIANFLFLWIWIFPCWSVVPFLSFYVLPIISVSRIPSVFWYYLPKVLWDSSSAISLRPITSALIIALFGPWTFILQKLFYPLRF